MADIDYRQIASHIVKDSKKLKTATRNTLNDVTFMAQKAVTNQALSDMTFRKDHKRALGLRVNKATYGNMESSIQTNRGWLAYHIEHGRRQATGGLVFRGQKYIVVPIMKEAFTKTKKFKKSFLKRSYIVPYKGEALMFFRGRKMKKSKLMAVLKREVEYNEDTDPQEVINKVVKTKGLEILQYELNYKR